MKFSNFAFEKNLYITRACFDNLASIAVLLQLRSFCGLVAKSFALALVKEG